MSAQRPDDPAPPKSHSTFMTRWDESAAEDIAAEAGPHLAGEGLGKGRRGGPPHGTLARR
jgi:hypothetical protein